TTSAPYFNPVAKTRTEKCEGGECRVGTEVFYGYDKFGNTILQHESGFDSAGSTIERTTMRRYFANSDLWIVGLPGVEAVYAGSSHPTTAPDSCDSGVSQDFSSCVDFYYDSASSCDEVSTNRMPTRGNLTREVRWSNQGDSPEFRYAYNKYGQVL